MQNSSRSVLWAVPGCRSFTPPDICHVRPGGCLLAANASAFPALGGANVGVAAVGVAPSQVGVQCAVWLGCSAYHHLNQVLGRSPAGCAPRCWAWGACTPAW